MGQRGLVCSSLCLLIMRSGFARARWSRGTVVLFFVRLTLGRWVGASGASHVAVPVVGPEGHVRLGECAALPLPRGVDERPGRLGCRVARGARCLVPPMESCNMVAGGVILTRPGLVVKTGWGGGVVGVGVGSLAVTWWAIQQFLWGCWTRILTGHPGSSHRACGSGSPFLVDLVAEARRHTVGFLAAGAPWVYLRCSHGVGSVDGAVPSYAPRVWTVS